MNMYEDISGQRYVFKQKLVLMKAVDVKVQTHSFLEKLVLLTITEILICLD